MNATIRRVLTASALSRRLYFATRQTYRLRRTAMAVGRDFLNADEFKIALRAHGERTGRPPHDGWPHDHNTPELQRCDDHR